MKQETQQQTASTTTSQKVVSQQAQKSSASAIDKLKEFGGFAFLENIIDGYSNLNPARKARRNIFLTDEQWENERKALVNRLSVWLKLLRENDTAEQMRDKAKETAENAENLLNHNLKNALARTRELESAYRTIAFFYKNTESDKVKNVTIVNATMEQLQDLDNTIFADHISNELKQNFDRLDLRRNYSLLVVPGYIGSNAILDKWSKMAYENKAFLGTKTGDTYYAKSYPCSDMDKNSKIELYGVPVYYVYIKGTDDKGQSVKYTWKALRFMPYYNPPNFSSYKTIGWVNSGLHKLNRQPAPEYKKAYEVHNTYSQHNGAIVLKGTFYIHAGPEDLTHIGWGAAGCVEIIGSFSEFKDQVKELSGSTQVDADSAISELVFYKKLYIEIEYATPPNIKANFYKEVSIKRR